MFLFFSLFFGHLAINNKDIIIAFSHVWIIYYLIKYTSKKFNIKNKFIVLFKISVLAAIGTGIQLLFLGSLIPMLIIFFVYMIIANKKKIGEIIIDLGICFILFYFILVLFWIDAHENIFVLPYKYFMDSLNVGWPYNLTNGVYTSSKEVQIYT